MYRLIRFGEVNLEHFNQVDAIGSGPTPTAYQSLPEGGALDLFGALQKHPATVERAKSFRLRANTEAELNDLYFQLLAMRGKRHRLYRRTATGDIHWIYARLVDVSAQRNFQQTQFRLIQDIDLKFVTQEAFWRGELGGTWFFDSGEFFDTGLNFDSGKTFALASSPSTITISIGAEAGRAPLRSARIIISAGAANMGNIVIARSGGETLTFNGVVNANKQLVIDCGAMQVTNGGMDAYNNLILSPTADLAAWFSLQPGENLITVSFVGDGAGKQIEFLYYESWF